MSTSGVTQLTFNGQSKFSSDFQQILDRSGAIASIPLQRLQNEQTDAISKKQTLGSLNSALADLSAKVAALGTSGSGNGLAASSSDSARVSVQASGATSSASYAITNITSVAQAASETTRTGYADSSTATVSPKGSMSLVVGSHTYAINVSKNNTLTGLRDAVNAANAGVTATILTTGTGSTPNYLSISSNTTGATTLQLIDDPTGTATNILTHTNQGANAVFNLNGIAVNRSTNLVNDIVPGLTFTILDQTDSGETVNLSLAPDRNTLSGALRDLATSYNAVASQVAAQTGAGGGLLTGDTAITQTQTVLRQLVSYQGTGSIKSLAELGIEIDSTGQMQFNEATLSALSDSQLNSAFQFLGSATKGFGALQNSINQISDPASGLIKTEEKQVDTADARLTRQISDLTARINNQQSGLMQKLVAADALLTQLESQQSMLTSTIAALDYATYGKQLGS